MEPAQSLKMNGLQTRTIRLSIDPHADFREVIRILDAIVAGTPVLLDWGTLRPRGAAALTTTDTGKIKKHVRRPGN